MGNRRLRGWNQYLADENEKMIIGNSFRTLSYKWFFINMKHSSVLTALEKSDFFTSPII